VGLAATCADTPPRRNNRINRLILSSPAPTVPPHLLVDQATHDRGAQAPPSQATAEGARVTTGGRLSFLASSTQPGGAYMLGSPFQANRAHERLHPGP